MDNADLDMAIRVPDRTGVDDEKSSSPSRSPPGDQHASPPPPPKSLSEGQYLGAAKQGVYKVVGRDGKPPPFLHALAVEGNEVPVMPMGPGVSRQGTLPG